MLFMQQKILYKVLQQMFTMAVFSPAVEMWRRWMWNDIWRLKKFYLIQILQRIVQLQYQWLV